MLTFTPGHLLQGKALALPSDTGVVGEASAVQHQASRIIEHANIILKLLDVWCSHFQSNIVQLPQHTVKAVRQCGPHFLVASAMLQVCVTAFDRTMKTYRMHKSSVSGMYGLDS